MHPSPVFHTKDTQENLAFAAARGFGILAVNGPERPLLSHMPFLLEDETVWLHLVRTNPITPLLRDNSQPALIAVSGPDSYISPDWYGVEDQVPTWNYITVHLRGELELRPNAELRAVIDRQSAFFEQQLRPKSPWTSDKMTPEVLERMMRSIIPCRMRVSTVNGTWKLGQNKPEGVRLQAASRVETGGIGSELAELATLMREAGG